MQTAIEFYDRLHERPFRPFRVYLKDGRIYEIRYPDMNMVGVSYLIIGVPEPNDPDPIADHSVKVPLSLIERVESLSEEPSGKAS